VVAAATDIFPFTVKDEPETIVKAPLIVRFPFTVRFPDNIIGVAPFPKDKSPLKTTLPPKLDCGVTELKDPGRLLVNVRFPELLIVTAILLEGHVAVAVLEIFNVPPPPFSPREDGLK
jgi:hypothetical protein